MQPNLFKPSHLKHLCEIYKIRPSKDYGQHYLISDTPINAMINASDLTPHDTVIEIGPGFGALTLAVAPLVKQVIALEIETKLKNYWEEQNITYPNIKILWGDALKNFQPKKLGLQNYKVLANLPYQITSPIIQMLLEASPRPELIVVMTQKEVAHKMCAKPGEMSLLSVAVQYYGDPKIITHVPRTFFWPEPKVDSAVVMIANLRQRTLSNANERNKDAKNFFSVVKAGFARKRKQLHKNLASGLRLPDEEVKRILREVTGNEKIRAEEVPVGTWQVIASRLSRLFS